MSTITADDEDLFLCISIVLLVEFDKGRRVVRTRVRRRAGDLCFAPLSPLDIIDVRVVEPLALKTREN